MQERKEFLKKIVRSAGKIVFEKFGSATVQYSKNDKLDLVTDADLASNDFIVKQIEKTFPIDGIISEEMKEKKDGDGYTWVIDPLDGTINFATGIPIFVVMIALLKGEEVEMSAIFDPVHEKFVFAKKNEGAFVNDVKMQCSREKTIASSRGIMSFVVKQPEVILREKIIKIGEAGNINMGVNAFGCAGFNAICVAEGKREWTIGFNTKLWDVAPCALLLSEAGCKVTNHKGDDWRPGMAMVAANEELHKELIELTKEIVF